MNTTLSSLDLLHYREDRTLEEIKKLKEEVHELAQSVRVYENFVLPNSLECKHLANKTSSSYRKHGSSN